jgi:hypothetical protein
MGGQLSDYGLIRDIIKTEKFAKQIGPFGRASTVVQATSIGKRWR